MNDETSPPAYEDGYLDSFSAPDKTKAAQLTAEDFYAYMPEHRYIYVPSREMWPSSSVNARLPPMQDGVNKDGDPKWVPATAHLDKTRPVEQMTWAPGYPMIVRDRLVSNGGWIEHEGATIFNQYREPQTEAGDAANAGKWVDHVRTVYPDDADHIIAWLAHRVQKPGEKINHALVLGGNQGIGKDSLLEPVKYAVGAWNFNEVSPSHLLGRFNGFVKSIILRVSEARDLGEIDRYAFYDHMKIYTAAPPDVLLCDEKNIREYAVFNVMGVIITSNHKTNGIHLPPDDRRHYVAWSDLDRESFTADYWNDLYGWYARGGLKDVATFLAGYDLSKFDAKAPPRKTASFWDIVDSGRAPEDAELTDLIEDILPGGPKILTIYDLQVQCIDEEFRSWLKDRRNSRQMPHRLESAGYTPVRNPTAKDGLWKINSKRQVVYGKKDLSISDRIAAVAAANTPGGWSVKSV